jgi:kinesin family protein 5
VAQPTVKDIFDGYNGTIFAYGQTGSGKTYTMFGTDDNKGIIPRTVEHIFEVVEQHPEAKYKVTASMLEIYKESLADLFALSPVELKIKESVTGIYVEGLSELEVNNAKTLLGLVDFGEQIRKVSSTRINEYSSRSHTIIMISIKSQLENAQTRSGKLYLVDLAGSEKVRRSGASGETL